MSAGGAPSIAVRTLEVGTEADAALDLAERVWGERPIAPGMLRALELAGLYLSGAFDGDDLVGMCAGLVGMHGDRPHLHSHLAAVVPSLRGRGVGRALKRHQRTWCLDRGIAEVTWTFDPLVRENARFNLHHLGAVGDRYLTDLYGALDDDINRGQPTDRLLVRWRLDSERSVACLDGPVPAPAAADLRAAGAVDAVVTSGAVPAAVDTDAPLRLVATPEDVVGIRRREPDVAAGWRQAVRHALTAALDAGLTIAAVADDGSYVLRPADGSDDPTSGRPT